MADQESPNELLNRTIDYVTQHRTRYLESRGAKGHIETFDHVGVPWRVPTLLLRTEGRRSGRPLIVPLIYGCYAGEWIVVGSKGGLPEHPAWYLNLLEQEEVQFQVATQCFRARWRVLTGDERALVWEYMAGLFPPYRQYRETAGDREIPVVALRPIEEIPVFEP